MPTLRRCSFAIASSLALLSACSVRASEERVPNVILICLDTVRADHLGAYGYRRNETTPFLDRFAKESILFEDASSSAGWTKPSVPSFLTSTYPLQHGVFEGSARRRGGEVTDVLAEEALTLAEVFEQHGFATGAFIKNAQLRRGNGFEQGFATFDDDAGDAREIRGKALDWIDGRGSEERPFFLYLHFLDAHWPYAVPDAYAHRFGEADRIARYRGGSSRELRDAINDGSAAFDDQDRRALEDLYDGALRFLDDELGQLEGALEERGILEDTILCVIADHGEEFGEHGRIGHGHGLFENLLHVPWILRVPGRPAERVDLAVSLVDLAPTLLAAAGFAAPAEMEGVDRGRDRTPRPIFAEHKAPDRYLQSLREGSWKLVRDLEPVERTERFPVRVGERWEIEFDSGDGARRALAMKPRDQDQGDPLEVKGNLTGLSGGGLRLGPFEVALTEDTARQFVEDVAERALAEGDLVKVRGSVVGGTLRAQRLKVYREGARAPLEVRGPVEEVDVAEAVGRVRLGGLWFTVDRDTHFKGVGKGRRRERLDREQILDHFTEASGTDFRIALRSYDLRLDPAEEHPEDGDGGDLEEKLERLSRDLAGRRSYSGGDERVLDIEALEGLRGIGYVR